MAVTVAAPMQVTEVSGVLAELAAVDDRQVCEALAAVYSSLMPVMVVSTEECRQRLLPLFQQGGLPQPDFLLLDHAKVNRPPRYATLLKCIVAPGC